MKLAKYVGLLATAAFVAWGLYAAQLPGQPGLDDIPLTYPPTRIRETYHGWPLLFLTRWETTDFWTPGPPEIVREVSYGALAADAGSWLVLIAATVYLSWRACSSRGRFSLGSLFALTTTLAIIFTFWRIERAYWSMPGDPFATDLLLVTIADTPMLRLLRFSPLVCTPVLLGLGCAVMCGMFAATAVVKRVLRMIGTLSHNGRRKGVSPR